MFEAMITWLLGIDPGATVRVEALRLRSAPSPWIPGVLVLAAVVFAAIVYLRERPLGFPTRLPLAMLRAAALALLIVLLFAPVLDVRIDQPVKPTVVVLLDGSQSMEIRDTRKEPRQLAEAAVALGLIPPDEPSRGRAVAKALRATERAGRALEDCRLDEARDAQQEIVATLDEILAGIKEDDAIPSARGKGEREIGAVIVRQKEVGRQTADHPGSKAGLDAMAAMQRQLAEELAQWNASRVELALSVPEQLKSRVTSVSRSRLAEGLLTQGEPCVFEEVAEKAEVRCFRFGESLEALDRSRIGQGLDSAAGPSQGLAASSASNVTCLAAAVQNAVDRFSGRPIAGVVLLTDGACNAGADPLRVAQQMGDRGVPLYPIGVGLARPDDLDLAGLIVQEVVFADDLVPLRVQVDSHGYEKRTAVLAIELEGAEVARKSIVLSGRPQLEELSFKAGSTSGAATLEVTVSPLPDEASIENNTIRTSIRVVDEKIKVVCIEGSPRWEYRYLRAVLKRDPRLDPTFITTEGDRDLARASKEHIGRFPDDEARAFDYDLVILGDVQASVFTPTQLSLMERLVRERGASLVMLAGHKHAPVEYLDTPLAAALPVRIEQGQWEEVGQDVHPVLTDEGRQGTVMTLEEVEAKNAALWANVKPLVRVAPLVGPKPGAKVLAQLSDSTQWSEPYPLVAWQRYGAGKTMFVGTDRLWRLRSGEGDVYHARFWGQTIQFLTLSRLLGENRRIRLTVAPAQIPLGASVDLYAHVVDELYQPLVAPAFRVEVAPLDDESESETVQLQPVPGAEGLYHTALVPGLPGRYQVAAGEADRLFANTVQLTVNARTAERVDVAMREDLLRQMADLSGGRYFTVSDLPLLPDVLPVRTATETVQKPVEVCDHWLVLVLFVGIVGIEWMWRRNRDLA